MTTVRLEECMQADTVEEIVVDGTPARDLYPIRQNSSRQNITSRQISRELGLNRPNYTGLHNHCQYQRGN